MSTKTPESARATRPASHRLRVDRRGRQPALAARGLARHGGAGAELAVGRATLYRAVDGRDRLLGDVLWSLAEATYAQARREVTSRGVDAILEISHRFTEDDATTSPRVRAASSSRSHEQALHMLLTPAGGVHERAVALHQEAVRRGVRRPRGRAHRRPRHLRVPLRAAARVDPLRRRSSRAPARSRRGRARRPCPPDVAG